MREFLLNSERLLDKDAFHFLENGEEKGLIPCDWIRFNDRIKLVYFTDSYENLGERLPQMSLDEICGVGKALLDRIKGLEGKHSISLENLVWDVDSIYLDGKGRVYGLCLPAVLPEESLNSQIYMKRVYAILEEMLEHTEVVMIAGNHDYIKKNSYYRTFSWAPHVHMICSQEIDCVELDRIQTAVYGCSYHSREIHDPVYDHAVPEGRQKYEILLAHGGDEKHIPIKSNQIMTLGYDYVAFGHIHKPQLLVENRMAYAGSLEPTDTGDIGRHGYIEGRITGKGCQIRFVPHALREYRNCEVKVDKTVTGHVLRQKITDMIAEQGMQHMYKITLTGYRDPDIWYELDHMDPYGNVVEITDHTKPAYDFTKLKNENKGNILGQYIESLEGYPADSLEYQALCEGVRALMETRRG